MSEFIAVQHKNNGPWELIRVDRIIGVKDGGAASVLIFLENGAQIQTETYDIAGIAAALRAEIPDEL